MTLKTQMAADLVTVFLNTNDFADAAIYTLREGGSCAITLVIGTVAGSAPAGVPLGLEQRDTMQGTLSLTKWKAAVATLVPGRLPIHGDTLTVASGGAAGTYSVQSYNVDNGDGLDLALVQTDDVSIGAEDVRVTR